MKLELHADFLAGVWAHHAEQLINILEAGDIEDRPLLTVEFNAP